MRLLQVSTFDLAGGAERIAWQLHRAYQGLGHDSWLAVGAKSSNDPCIFAIPTSPNSGMSSATRTAIGRYVARWRGRVKGCGWLTLWLTDPGEFRRLIGRRLGHEIFEFPGTREILQLPPLPPDILHCHNLHGPDLPHWGYFDLRQLPSLSAQVPTVMTLHDAWLLSGHCAHSFGCDRWESGCGQCPDLTIPPAIHRDATAFNWKRKKRIYLNSHLHIATPSRWLMEKVNRSILEPSIVTRCVIPNGVDLTVFCPADKAKARQTLGIAKEAKLLVFSANGIRQNPWKDYATLRAAFVKVASVWSAPQPLLFHALGEDSPPEKVGAATIKFIPHQSRPQEVARYYQAADLYIHAAKVDTFPNTVLEALACGAPVVATAVGGIPEQIKGLQPLEQNNDSRELNSFSPNEATGILVPAGNAEEMASAIKRLLTDDNLRTQLGRNAAKDAADRFSLERQAQTYLDWYAQILAKPNSRKSATTEVAL